MTLPSSASPPPGRRPVRHAPRSAALPIRADRTRSRRLTTPIGTPVGHGDGAEAARGVGLRRRSRRVVRGGIGWIPVIRLSATLTFVSDSLGTNLASDERCNAYVGG